MPPIRAFLSFDPPAQIRADICSLQRRLRDACPKISWVRPQLFHSTLTFLGDVGDRAMIELLPAIAAVASQTPPFDVTYEGVGTFPDARRPTVLWVGCVPKDGVLLRLKTELDAAVSSLGIALESRAFHPHVTLGRIRSPQAAKDLTPMLETLTFEPRNARIVEIHVMKSDRTPQGADYAVVTTNHLHSSEPSDAHERT